MTDPKQRPFTRIAAKAIGGLHHLEAGRCPTCGHEIGPFRNQQSRREFEISGMCQWCQDQVFGED
jgi:hypothetical protein